METIVRILIVARPGHFRESLVAVLKTLPRVELFLVDRLSRDCWDEPPMAQPAIVLVELDASDGPQIRGSKAASLGLLKEKYPGVRCVALVDNIQQARAARSVNADVMLSRGASAGELIAAIQRLSASSPATARYVQVYPASAMS